MDKELFAKLLDFSTEATINAIIEVRTILLLAILICCVLLLNQRKIKKELRQLRELLEERDKPQK